MPSTKTNIIQWNIQGIRNKKSELLQLIEDYRANIIAIQETKSANQYLPKIQNYNTIAEEGHYNNGYHGGVAMYIHSSIPFTQVQLSSPIQAVAAVVNIRIKFTICNIYLPRSQNLSTNDLLELYQQLPQPCVIVGDFNSYHTLWGCNTDDTRGRCVRNFIETQDLILLNNGSPTRIGHQSETAIDLSLASPSISPSLEWQVLSSVLDSDHCPITIALEDEEPPNTSYLLMKQANWELFRTSSAWSTLPSNPPGNAEALDNFYRAINQAANEAIPRNESKKYYPKPWWNDDLKASRALRERLYDAYRRNKTLNNLIKWKIARAKHKRAVKIAQKEHWKQYISELNFATPISDIYRKIKRIKGAKATRINIIKTTENSCNTSAEIAQILAETFAEVSSSNNYDPTFLDIKSQRESNIANFGNSSAETYNQNFSMDELNFVISKTRDTAPGQDEVNYQMIKNMPKIALEYFLRMINSFFNQSYFPDEWNTSIIIPILKPGKNPESPYSYRPIALTSCLCKILERMINERLLQFLKTNNILTNVQCGGIKNRSTVDNLIRLEDAIRTAYVRDEHFISIFFDLERAYDMTWRKGIVIDLYEGGLRGLLPKYIAAFLDKRFLITRVNGHASQKLEQENGVPQGAVLSVTLFALRINGIIKNLPHPTGFMTSLFVDDLQVGFRHADLSVLQRVLQKSLCTLEAWTKRNGFKFSSAKTKVVHFTKSNRIYGNLPALTLNGQTLKYDASAKFLGLIFDSKLTWKTHVVKINNECSKLLGLMKMITNQKWGADQYCLMKVFRMYIRSKMDYGAIVYASAKPDVLRILNTTCNEALRIATGAFKSTPVESLYVLTSEMKPNHRRDYLSLRYYLKLRSILSNPAHSCLQNNYETLFRNKNETLPFSLRINHIKNWYSLPRHFIIPEFSTILHPLAKPTYAQVPPDINKSLYQFPKSTTPIAQYQQNFLKLRHDQYSGYETIFTDGSKTTNGVGAAVVQGTIARTATLPQEASIFSAELHAIKMANEIIKSSSARNFVVFTDSRSVLDALHPRNDHPLIRQILYEINIIQDQEKRIEYCWVPSHVGIAGNDRADAKAKSATSRSPELIPIHYQDYYPSIKLHINRRRQEEWTDSEQKLVEIKPTIEHWAPTPGLRRREEVILNRLRTGHSLLTHGYLMDDSVPRIPPVCEYCNNSILTIKHILVQCPNLSRERLTAFHGGRQISMQEILGEFSNLRQVIVFLDSLAISDEI